MEIACGNVEWGFLEVLLKRSGVNINAFKCERE